MNLYNLQNLLMKKNILKTIYIKSLAHNLIQTVLTILAKYNKKTITRLKNK
jgi:hypothetical protein